MSESVPTTQNQVPRAQIVESPSGEALCPQNIIASTTAARSIYVYDRQAHVKRTIVYSSIEGLIAGNPPYDPADLLRHGIDHIANFNDLTARSIYNRSALAYWNLLYQTQRIADFEVYGGYPEAIRIGNSLSDNFDYVIRKWKGFNTFFNTLAAQLVKFGVSPVFWRDERDWRPMVVELQRFYVSNLASTNTEELTHLSIESIFTGQYLWEQYMYFKDKEFVGPTSKPIKDEKDNGPKDPIDNEKYSPWNINVLKQLLLFYANQSTKSGNQIKDFMDLERRIQENDFMWDNAFGDGFRIVSFYYREYDGKISHYMFDRDFTDAGEFLYFVNRQYETIEEAVVTYTASPGEFTIHSNRGVGHCIFSACQAQMQLTCASFDMAKMTSTPFLKTNNVGGKEFGQIKIFPGIPTDIGQAEFVQTNFGANIGQLIELDNYFIQKINYNAANSGDDPGLPDRDTGSKSAPEVQIKSLKEFGLPKNNIQHFYSYMDTSYHNIAAKFWHCEEGWPGYEYVREWKERCIADGVPEIIFETKGVGRNELPPGICVKASRVAGDGSTAGTLIGLQAVQPYAGQFTEEGKKEYARMGVRAVFGANYVKPLLGDQSEDVGGEVTLASMENSLFKLGESSVVNGANEQQTHIVTHTALFNDIINQLKQQQMTPVDADKIFAVALPHTEQHIQIYSQSPFAEEFLKGYLPTWKEITRFAENNRVYASKMVQSEMRKREEDAQKTEQVMTDAQRKDFTAQKDAQRADFKVASQVQRAGEANVNRAQVMTRKVELDADNKRLAVQLNAQAKASANVETNQKAQLGTYSDIELQNLQSTLGGSRPAQDDFE